MLPGINKQITYIALVLLVMYAVISRIIFRKSIFNGDEVLFDLKEKPEIGIQAQNVIASTSIIDFININIKNINKSQISSINICHLLLLHQAICAM